MSDETIMPFDFPAENPTIIKVIGVGGGGGNAVNHMYKEGIHDVTFVVCNTDNQALAESPVPVKLQLGKEGLGAGNRPERAREAAEESIEDVKGMLNDGCKMVFITAGMGGGTGTGAAPIIAKTAKDMDILTVGIVTIPFLFEGNRKIDQALDGLVEEGARQTALITAHAGSDELTPPGLVGKVRIRQKRAAQGHHVAVTQSQNLFGHGGIIDPAAHRDGDGDRVPNGLAQPGKAAGRHIAGDHGDPALMPAHGDV